MNRLEVIGSLELKCIEEAKRGIMPYGALSEMFAETRNMLNYTKKVVSVFESEEKKKEIFIGYKEMTVPYRNMINGLEIGTMFAVKASDKYDAKHIQASILGAITDHNKRNNTRIICTVNRTIDGCLIKRIQ